METAEVLSWAYWWVYLSIQKEIREASYSLVTNEYRLIEKTIFR